MKYLLFGLMSFFSTLTMAQNVLNAVSPEQLRRDRENKTRVDEAGDTISTAQEPMKYGFVEDKDVLWSKVVWEVIDLNERLNQPYYISGDELVQNSKSLYDVLVEGIRDKKITEVYDDEYFKNKMTYDQIMARNEKKDTQQFYFDMIQAGEKPDEGAIFNFKIKSDDVKMIKTKGLWYIDRRLGELKYRLLGLAIMGPDAQSLGTEFADNSYIDLFWIWYPDARKTLANYSVYNPGNSNSAINFDELLNARRFSSIIYKAQTTFGTKMLEDYIPNDAKAQLEEHHKIRNSIIQTEADMWNY
ncbi:gliding motility protein GldN [Chishuiella sp.]|uniref:type IX secretion system ring protein PorN/GldN n=1 Tax=Chishuiella sp. TaxID=1969467 RepID=UPI0028B1CBC4|nr:gliding motility protein GldN [Chishuiella sp.]